MRKSSVRGHRSAARYTTVIIIIIIIVIGADDDDDDDGIVNPSCKMDCSGTVIFGRKRGEIMINNNCVYIVPARAKTVQKKKHRTESDLRP
jgi:hypothetical protein